MTAGRALADRARSTILLLLPLLLAACAQVPRTPAVEGPVRTGRLAMSVQDQPGQSFSAGFELRGTARAGELTLFTPVGGTAAVLRWDGVQATLESPGREPQRFDSVEAMVEKATGAPVPVAALFDWLAGVPTPVPGWEPDLAQLAEGRLRARRVQPPPVADLRVVLDH
jgi:outer membrane lipoprotein LolB